MATTSLRLADATPARMALIVRSGSWDRPVVDSLTAALTSIRTTAVACELGTRPIEDHAGEVASELVALNQNVALIGLGKAAGPALAAAADNSVRAVVIIGNELSVPRRVLQKIASPVLFIVDRRDIEAIEKIREQAADMPGQTEIYLLAAGATLRHNQRLRELVCDWVTRFVPAPPDLAPQSKRLAVI